MTISRELLDELLSGVERPEDLLGDKGLMKELKVRLMESSSFAKTSFAHAIRSSRVDPVFWATPLVGTLARRVRPCV